MTDRSQMMQSPAYAALSPAGRKVLAAIEREVERGGGVVVIGLADFAKLCACRKAVANGLKQVDVARLCQCRQRGRVHALITSSGFRGWTGIDTDEAEAAAVAGTAAEAAARAVSRSGHSGRRRRCRSCRGTMRGDDRCHAVNPAPIPRKTMTTHQAISQPMTIIPRSTASINGIAWRGSLLRPNLKEDTCASFKHFEYLFPYSCRLCSSSSAVMAYSDRATSRCKPSAHVKSSLSYKASS